MIELNMSCREEKSQLKGNFLRQGGRPLVQHLCGRLRPGVPHPQRERPLYSELPEQVQVQEEEVMRVVSS